MIQLSDNIVIELLAALKQAEETFSDACEDCDHDGSFSFSRGRLFSIHNVIEQLVEDAPRTPN